MKEKFTLSLTKNKKAIEVEYVEQVFSPTENTGITLYDDYKISIMLSDGMFAVTDNIAYRATRGDVFVFRPDEIHFARIIDQKTHKFLNIFIPTDFFDDIAFDTENILTLLKHSNRENIISPTFEDKEKLISAITPITEDLKNGKALNTINTFTNLLNVLIMLYEFSCQPAQYSGTKNIPSCVTNTLDFITKNYGSKITLNDLARQSYCSVAYLSKTFKKFIGCTVYEQLTTYRITNAKKMLKAGKSVTEVCYDCGFTDSSHFIKTFKKSTGVTPYKYKAE